MILGGLAEGTGFSAAEIEGFTADQAAFWWNCLMAFREAVKKES